MKKQDLYQDINPMKLRETGAKREASIEKCSVPCT